MDHLDSHRGMAVRKHIGAAGAHLLVAPPCIADLNPTEQVLAKFKHLTRGASEGPVDAARKRPGSFLDSFAPEQCAEASAQFMICFYLK
ncbi:MAG: hypothetical protein ACXIU7_13600 [Roseinatronobacter sp.]